MANDIAVVESLAERWRLEVGSRFAAMDINFVAAAVRVDGTRCVLKVSRDLRETRSEIAALRLWDGIGAARLLDADPAVGALLVEQLEPGTTLASLVNFAEANADSNANALDDDAATRIAASVLRHLWRPLPPDSHDLIPLATWCAAFDRNRDVLSAGTGGFPRAMFERADTLRRDLLASTTEQTLLHGDLHHFNILRAQRADWLAIDPKGLAGDRHFDVCQFLRNPQRVPPEVNRRRLDILCGELDLDRSRAKDWCFVHAVLDACWDFEDGNPVQPAVAYADETLAF